MSIASNKSDFVKRRSEQRLNALPKLSDESKSGLRNANAANARRQSEIGNVLNEKPKSRKTGSTCCLNLGSI